LARELEEIQKSYSKNTKLHVVAYSFAGVDARAAISMFGANKNVQSLTTVCSPHHGMKLIDNYHKDEGRYELSRLDKPLEILGLSLKNFEEFSSRNMRAFNSIADN
jgi:hypothetical protein